MIVEQPEHLRAWLSQVLQPLCDADPFALAKYVIALVKKDRDETELRNSMREQLDVFLQTQTEPFVNRLFAVLKSKEYLPNTSTETKPTDVLEIDSGASSDIAESEHSVSGHVSDDVLSSAGSHKSTAPPTTGNKTTSKKDEDDRDRTKSRRKINTRSPPHRDSQGARAYASSDSSRYTGSENDHKFTRSWTDRNQRRPIRAPRRRSRSRPRTRRHRHDYGSRSRSPVYSYSDSSSKQKDSSSGGSQKGGRDSKDPSSASAGAGGTAKSGTSKHESGGEEQQPGNAPPGSNRCRDYDEKGLCMRGELCPFDHGINPVVLEEAVKGDYHRMQVEMQEAFPSRVVRVGPSAYGEGVNHPWPPHPFGSRVFMDGRGPRGPPMVQYPAPPVVPRLLVDIPVMGVPSPQGQEMMPMDMPLRGMPRGAHPGRGFYLGGRGRGRGGFDRGRLGMKTMKSNCALQVKKIPIESNNIMALNGHFCKFGKIINIQINFENDPEAALVTFSSPDEAFRAYKSTEAVLNNRFIRVYWHNKEKENEDGDGSGAGRVSVKDRLGEPSDFDSDKPPGDEGQIFPPGEGFPKHNFPPGIKKDPTTERLEKVEAIKKSQEMLAAQETLRKALEEKKKETLKLMNNLKIRKRDIMKEHIEHQKKLIRKLETEGGTMPQDEKDQLFELMATLQNTIEKMKSDLDGTTPPESIETAVASQKDMLDAELELYSREQDGSGRDPSELKRSLGGLRSKVPAKRGRGGIFRNSHVGSFHPMESNLSLRSVDRRTTVICVTGFDSSKYDEILTHFKKYGPITLSEPLLDQNAVKLTFSNRKAAELAKSNGKVFAGRALDVQWVDKPNPEKKYVSRDSSNGSNSQPDDVDETRTSDVEDHDTETSTSRSGGLGLDQLYDHDEDEETDGERSWRR